ncbi:MAG: hypothetical protein J2P20_04255, partial [Pseudonocardia sp.]|nr:hypothetical protein [Pseudonocardia sp.]
RSRLVAFSSPPIQQRYRRLLGLASHNLDHRSLGIDLRDTLYRAFGRDVSRSAWSLAAVWKFGAWFDSPRMSEARR